MIYEYYRCKKNFTSLGVDYKKNAVYRVYFKNDDAFCTKISIDDVSNVNVIIDKKDLKNFQIMSMNFGSIKLSIDTGVLLRCVNKEMSSYKNLFTIDSIDIKNKHAVVRDCNNHVYCIDFIQLLIDFKIIELE